MANIKSAKKRVLISTKKHDRNRVVRSAVKTHVTRVRRLVDSGETAPATEVVAAVRALDKAAEHGILHPNNVARRKSRLMRMVAKAAALAANPEAAALAAAEAKAHAKGTAKSKTKAGKKAAAAKSAAARSTAKKR
jgi:small subunit ribosomal protein S20